MGGVIQSSVPSMGERVIHVDKPETFKKIADLMDEIARLKEPKIKLVEPPVDNVVEKLVEDPRLIERLNEVLRENAQLKKFQGPTKIVEKEVIKLVEVPIDRIVARIVSNRKLEISIGILSAIAGVLLGKLI